MGLETGDIIRITDYQTLAGQQILNVYTYIAEVVAEFSANYCEVIASQFWLKMLPELTDVQHTALTHEQLYVENLTNGLDFGYLLTGDIGGAGTGQCMASFDSYGIKLNRTSKNTRNGSKRIAGVPEVNQDSSVLTSGAITALESLGDRMVEHFSAVALMDNTWQMNPIIVGRNPDGTYDLSRFSYVASYTVNPRVTSQVSRKQ